MTNVSHTPGPWTYDKLDQVDPTDVAAFRIDSTVEWENVADVFQKSENGEAEANARLISSAPDLLEACRAGVRTIKTMSQMGQDVSALVSLFQKLEAAIEKATQER